MKICDRCFNLAGNSRPAMVPVIIGPENYDLCVSCADAVKSVISENILDNIQKSGEDGQTGTEIAPKKRRGRKKTKESVANA